MFLLSYIWHGLLFNDFAFMLISAIQIFFVFVVLYLLLASFICYIINNFYDSLTTFLAFTIAGFIGVVGYFLINAIGFNFNDSHSKIQLLVDLLWQLVEQGAGGVICFKLLAISKKEL